MSITSYAQNFEDVMLWRALGHVPNGFYIDLGAQHPVTDSVSKAFYEKGWRGIHVEATPTYAALLRQDRPDETVIEAAVNDVHGVISFFEIPSTGISTGNKEVAFRHKERGFDVHEISVPCVTLADIFQRAGTQVIHWLKIDVEGMELKVLSSWGKNKVRPWVIVIESTEPLSQTATHLPWEHCLLERGYRQAYFDGLNRFYLAADQGQLATSFAVGPNVFDAFTLHGAASSTFCEGINKRHRLAMDAMQAQLRTKAQEAQLLQEQQAALAAKLMALEHQWQLKLQTLQDQRKEAEHNNTRNELALRQLVHQTHQQAQSQAQNHLQSLVKREQAFAAQLHALQLEQSTAQELHYQRKLELEAKASRAIQDAQAQAQGHLQTLNQREKVFSQQLAQMQSEKQALQAQALAREHELHAEAAEAAKAADAKAAEREIALQNKATAALNTAAAQAQARLDALAQSYFTREAALQADAARAHQALTQAHAESEKNLQILAEREQQAAEDLLELQNKHHQQQLMWTAQQKDLSHEIAKLNASVHSQKVAAASQAGMHAHEVEKKATAHRIELENCATLEVQLKAEIFAEQQKNQQLTQALAEVVAGLAAAQATWSWRAAAPLRALGRLVGFEPSEDCSKLADSFYLPPRVTSEPRALEPSTTDITMPESLPISALTVSPKVESATDLLECHGEDFIQLSYQILLGRSPDPEGFAYYLGRLRAGHGKPELLHQLRSSAEGRSRSLTLPGLREVLSEHRKSRHWFFRWTVKSSHSQRQLNRLEDMVAALQSRVRLCNHKLEARFTQVEHGILALQASQTPVHSADVSPLDPGNEVPQHDNNHLGHQAQRWMVLLQHTKASF